MKFIELAKRRVSVRKYKPDPPSEEDVRIVLEAGRMAPSAKNLQPWHVVVVRDPDRRAALREAYKPEWFSEAPVIIAVCVEPEAAWVRMDGKNYVDIDGAIAMDHMILCAAERGLGTCWIGAFDRDAVCRVLELPEGIEPLVMTPLGYPLDQGRPKKRKPLDEILHIEQW